jgi:uncharacterized membrane protein
MHNSLVIPERKTGGNLEALMQKVSLVVSLVAVSLMIGGFVGHLISRGAFIMPGEAVLPLSTLVQFSEIPVNLATMSAGIVLLALLPTVRVLLALWLYARRRNLLDTLFALIVLLELLLSIHTGG